MVPTSPDRGRSPLRGNGVLDDDDWTVYSDAESVSSYSTVSDNYFSMQDRQDHAPVL
jgi:Wiskott-Aldrich syndrome protein